MADRFDIGEAESSESDSVSLTSTQESDGEGKEFEVDCILAETIIDGVTKYLTQWTGYPETKATLQEIDDFIEGSDVFKCWKEKKMRISRGYEPAFNIDAWQNRCEEEDEKSQRRRNKRAKKKARLNKHVDLLPSDPEDEGARGSGETSEEREMIFVARASPNSSSEDDDSPSSARGPLRNNVPKASWTDEEQKAFIRGLQEAKGPYWSSILAWYGYRGSINQLLEKKSRKDMQVRLEQLREEFTKAGRDPPDYMNLPISRKSSKALQRSSMAGKRHSMAESHEQSGSDSSGSDSSSIIDSMSTETLEKETTKRTLDVQHFNGPRKEKVSLTKGISKPSGNDPEVVSTGLEKEGPPSLELSDLPKNGSKAGSFDPGMSKLDTPTSGEPSRAVKSDSVLEKALPGFTEQPSALAGPKRQQYSGTARATPSLTTADEPMLPQESLIGVVGSGPAPLPLSRPKAQASGPRPLSKIGGIDGTADWGTTTDPKLRKTAATPTADAATGSIPAGKLYNLSRRNSVFKRRREEPAPKLAEVVLLDPKTNRPPKPLPTSSAVTSTRTPFQQFREELAAKEVGAYHAADSERPGIKESVSRPITSHESSTEAETDEQPNVRASTVRFPCRNETNSTVDRRLERTPRPRPRPRPQPTSKQFEDTGPLLEAPAGTRVDAKVSAPPPSNLKPHLFESHISPTPTSIAADDVISSLTHAQQLASSFHPLTLMGNPTLQEKRKLWGRSESDQVYGNIKVGPALKDLGRMKLLGSSRHIKRLLLANRNRNYPNDMGLDFKTICTAVEYQNHLHRETTEYIGSGYIVPSPEAQEEYDAVAHLLACQLSTAISFANQFSMIIWPAHSSIWGFLEDDLPTVPPGAVLRFAIRNPMPQRLVEETEPTVANHRRVEDLEQYEAFQAKINDTSVEEGRSISAVFRDIFDIDFDRLIASNGIQRYPLAKKFFLCFHCANCENYKPDESKCLAVRWRVSEEHDLFVDFLRENGVDAIYSMQDIGSCDVKKNGSWDYFRNNVKSGAIILHDCCGRPDQLPHLAKFLRYQGEINVWKISLSPMDLEIEDHPHLVRLFPHGGVICLTSSLILYHPHEALRMLRWFRLFHLPSKPSGIWKIAVRPRIRGWLLDIQDLSCEESGQTPFGFSMQVFADIYTEIWALLARVEEPYGLMVQVWDSEVPLREAPVISASHLPRGRKEWTGDTFASAEVDHKAIRSNDEEIIQWFSEWAGIHLHQHRKFHVVLGYPKAHEVGDRVTKRYEKGYGYLEHGLEEPDRQKLGLLRSPDSAVIESAWERNFLEIMSYDKFFELHNVKDQATIDKAETDRRQKVRDNASRLLVEAERERREARQAAKQGLQKLMQMCRDQGGTEEQARAVGRRRLRWKRDEQGTATSKEVENCAIDMDLVPGNQAGWNHKLIAGTPEERAQAREDQDRELQRLADKERLSGTRERECLWDIEIEMWAAQDRARAEQSEDQEMTDVFDEEVSETEILSHTLYTKVQALEPKLATKLTGMLLQLETSKIQALLQNAPALSAKVTEAKSLFLAYVVTDEAWQSGEAEVWAPALKAYRAAEAGRGMEAYLGRKRVGGEGRGRGGAGEEGGRKRVRG